MRKAYLSQLLALAERDPAVMLLTGDLGYGVVEAFARRWPQRFINAGVAEQNMIAVAAGLASVAMKPHVYSIAPFVTARAFEAVRDGAALHRLPLRLVGIGGGFDYGHAGYSHHAFDDIALMRLLPNVKIIAPRDDRETADALAATSDWPDPIYFRLAKDPTPPHAAARPSGFGDGSAQRIYDGQDLSLVSSGRVTALCLDAAQILQTEGIGAEVVHMPYISADALPAIAATWLQPRLLVVVEDHGVTGGLGSLVAEWAAVCGTGHRVIKAGIEDPCAYHGSAAYLARRHGLDAQGIAERVRHSLGG